MVKGKRKNIKTHTKKSKRKKNSRKEDTRKNAEQNI